MNSPVFAFSAQIEAAMLIALSDEYFGRPEVADEYASICARKWHDINAHGREFADAVSAAMDAITNEREERRRIAGRARLTLVRGGL